GTGEDFVPDAAHGAQSTEPDLDEVVALLVDAIPLHVAGLVDEGAVGVVITLSRAVLEAQHDRTEDRILHGRTAMWRRDVEICPDREMVRVRRQVSVR